MELREWATPDERMAAIKAEAGQRGWGEPTACSVLTPEPHLNFGTTRCEYGPDRVVCGDPDGTTAVYQRFDGRWFCNR
jgi:hypothetical protein